MVDEIIGLVATVFVLISFLEKEPCKIRKINIIGAGLFAIYGLRIEAFSTWVLNLVLMIIHFYFLWREHEKE